MFACVLKLCSRFVGVFCLYPYTFIKSGQKSEYNGAMHTDGARLLAILSIAAYRTKKAGTRQARTLTIKNISAMV